jgi:hypothetical protein
MVPADTTSSAGAVPERERVEDLAFCAMRSRQSQCRGQRAVIKYLQRDAGLPQTGQMNATTQAALARFLAHGNNQMGG